eukprot:354689-Hanusia_phi.AAC.2
MAFARPYHMNQQLSRAWQKHDISHHPYAGIIATTANCPFSNGSTVRFVSTKHLKKFRKQVSEKLHKALELKNEMISVQEQLASLGGVIDSLSQIMVDEIDALCGEVNRFKVDTSDQFTLVAKGVQRVAAEVAELRSSLHRVSEATDMSDDARLKLRRWAEAGFLRLSEAAQIQQQALTVLDGQVGGLSERLADVRGQVVACRGELVDCRAEKENLNAKVNVTVRGHEKVAESCREQLEEFQRLSEMYEEMCTDRKTLQSLHLQEIARLETQLQDHRSLTDTRLNVLEKNLKLPNVMKGGTPSERRINDLEAELSQAKKLIYDQETRFRELYAQSREQSALDKLQERHELTEVVTRLVNESLLKRGFSAAARSEAEPGLRGSFSSPETRSASSHLDKVIEASQKRMSSLKPDR